MKNNTAQSYDIIMVLPHLGPGGAQKVAARLMNYWAKKEKTLCLITFYDKADVYTLDHRIHLVNLHDIQNNKMQVRRLGLLRLSVFRHLGLSHLSFFKRIILARIQSLSVITDITRYSPEDYSYPWKAVSWIGAPIILCCQHTLLIIGRLLSLLRQFMKLTRKEVKQLLSSFRHALKALSTKLYPLVIDLILNQGQFLIKNRTLCMHTLRIFRLFCRLTASRKNESYRIYMLHRFIADNAADAVISFIGATNLRTVIAGCGQDIKIIISERNDPDRQALNPPWEQLRKLLYGHADIVTANSRGAIGALAAYVPKNKLVYIPNPIDQIDLPVASEQRKKLILYVGRLEKQKQVDKIIAAFAAIKNKINDWRFSIVGDGPERDMLEKLACHLGVGNMVIFHGYKNNVSEHYLKSSIFVLNSDYEGTPNALLEALCYRLPAIVCDSSPGICELIEHDTNGLVFPHGNQKQLAELLLTLAKNKDMRTRFGNNSMLILPDLSIDSIISKWEDVIY